MTDKKKFEYGPEAIKRCLAAFLLLFSLLVLLSPNTHLRGLGFALAYPFGPVGLYAITLGGAFLCVRRLFFRNLKIGVRNAIGAVLLIVSIGLLLNSTLGSSLASYSSLEAYHARAMEDYGGANGGFYGDFSLGLGAIGAFLSGLFVQANLAYLAILFASAIMVGGLALLSYPAIRSLIAIIKAKQAIRKAKQEQDAQSPLGPEPAKEGKGDEPLIAPEDVDDSFDSYSPDEGVSNPLMSFRFQPAGEVELPKRRGNASLTPSSSLISSNEAPIIDSSRLSGSTRVSGLHEAVFVPHDSLRPAAPEHGILVEPDEGEPEKPTVEATKPEQAFAPIAPMPRQEDEPAPQASASEQFIAPVFDDADTDGQIPEEPTIPSAPALVAASKAPKDPSVSAPAETLSDTPEDAACVEIPLPKLDAMPSSEPQKEAPKATEAPKAAEASPAAQPQQEEGKMATPRPASQGFTSTMLPEGGMDSVDPAFIFQPFKKLPAYQLPPDNLLKPREIDEGKLAELEQECVRRTEIINTTFENLHVGAHVVGHTIGPSVTRYDIETDPDTPVTTISRYIPDVAMRLGGVSVRFSELVMGKSTSGLEVINSTSRVVHFSEVYSGLKKTKGITIPFGEDIDGKILGADLTSFPHMLLAGTTGSGKSVFINSILMAMLMRYRPEELKICIIDPKMVGYTKFADIPHFLCPIVTDAHYAKLTLKRLVDLMEFRYHQFQVATVTDINEFNSDYAEYAHVAKMPYVVLIVDEYADLVEQEKDIQSYVLRLAQKARAAGIHMILATQRPDVKVITGTIKANLPVHVALMVANAIDSQTILGCGGAEELAPHGDMLVDCAQVLRKELARCQGCLVEGSEIRSVVSWIKNQQKTVYDPAFLDLDKQEEEVPQQAVQISPADLKAASDEEKYQIVKAAVMTREYCSISQIQRDFSVGFTRGGKIMKRLQEEGIVAPDGANPNSTKGNKVLVHSAPEGPAQ